MQKNETGFPIPQSTTNGANRINGCQILLGYANERLQSRSLSGVTEPDKPADPIMVHPDVRRMLLTQKTLIEGGRMLAAYTARQLDLSTAECAHTQAAASKRAELMTPIVKAFLTDAGQEITNHGVQVYGGHGYIREWGMEQLMRDGRITQLYEGTNGIQALDLIRRKLMLDKGAEMAALQEEMTDICRSASQISALAALSELVGKRLQEWAELTDEVLRRCQQNPQEIGAVSVDFLHYCSYVLIAGLWLKAAGIAQHALDGGTEEADFYRTKLHCAEFFIRRMLPRASGHREALLGGADCLMALPAEHFAF